MPQSGVGQTPSSLPLTASVRERGSSVTPAFEGWYFDKDGSVRLLVGYFNRNTKQEFDIPVGPNNRIEPGRPIRGSRRISAPGAQLGRLFDQRPERFRRQEADLDDCRQRLHQRDHAPHQAPTTSSSRSRTPRTRTRRRRSSSRRTATSSPGRRKTSPQTYTATVGMPLPMTRVGDRRRAEDQRAGAGARPWTRARRGAAAARRGDAARPWRRPAGRGAARARRRGARAARRRFQPPPPLAINWSKFRGPGDVKFDNARPSIDRAERQGHETRPFPRPASTSCASKATTRQARAAAGSSAAGPTPTSA